MSKKENLSFQYDPACALCESAVPLCGEKGKGQLFCRRVGVVSAGYHCRKFSFDPLKRNPPPRPRFRGLDEYLGEEAAPSFPPPSDIEKSGEDSPE